MDLARSLRWRRQGEDRFVAALGALDDLELPSRLPGWTRRTLVAHVAENARALCNLLEWAETGREHPMYESADARRRGIEQTARLPVPSLLEHLAKTRAELDRAIDSLPACAWNAPLRSAVGRPIRAHDVPWMRCREVWVHAVDLAGDVGFDDLPDDLLRAVLDDAFTLWRSRGREPRIELRSGESVWGPGPAVIEGTLPELVALVTGRVAPSDPGISLPEWL